MHKSHSWPGTVGRICDDQRECSASKTLTQITEYAPASIQRRVIQTCRDVFDFFFCRTPTGSPDLRIHARVLALGRSFSNLPEECASTQS